MPMPELRLVRGRRVLRRSQARQVDVVEPKISAGEIRIRRRRVVWRNGVVDGFHGDILLDEMARPGPNVAKLFTLVIYKFL